MSSIDDLLAKLSPEEQKKHKALIQECRERESQVNHDSARSSEMLASMQNTYTAIRKRFERAGTYIQAIGEAAAGITSDSIDSLNQKQTIEDQLADINLELAYLKFKQASENSDS